MKVDFCSRELTMEVVVGVFLVMIFLGLGYFTIILSHDTWFGPSYNRVVIFSDVMGLREGDNVYVRGMPVGKIQDLELKDEGVHLLLSLDQRLNIRTNYVATIVATSVLGGRHLRIEEGTSAAPPLPPDEPMYGEDPYDLMQNAAETMNALRDALVDGGIVDNIRDAAAQIREITERVNAGKGTLGRLLSEDDALYRDVAASVAALRNVAERLDRGEGALGKLLSADDKIYEDVAAAVQSLREVAQRLERGEGTLGKLLTEDSELYANLNAAVAALRDIAETIQQGEGTVGRLVKDEELYEDVEEIVNEVRAAVDDFRETSPITSFSSILFGAF